MVQPHAIGRKSTDARDGIAEIGEILALGLRFAMRSTASILWEELFSAEQAPIVQLLVERIDVGADGIDIRLRTNGFRHLAAELDSGRFDTREAA